MHIPTKDGSFIHLDYQDLENEVLISIYNEEENEMGMGCGIDDPEVLRIMIEELQALHERMVRAGQ